MKEKGMPIANPLLVLREEFDDWAVLFDPETGEAHGLNPTSVFIWKRLDGAHTAADIVRELSAACEPLPGAAHAEVEVFIRDLVQKGYAGYEQW